MSIKPEVPRAIKLGCRVPGYRRLLELGTRRAIKRLRDRFPRELILGLNSTFLTKLTRNIDRDGDGKLDTFVFALTNAWFDQGILKVDLGVDGIRVGPERIRVISQGKSWQGDEPGPIPFTPGAPLVVEADGVVLANGIHFLDIEFRMELADLIIPGLPIVMRDGICTLPLLDILRDEMAAGGEIGELDVHLIAHIHYDVEWLQGHEVFERVGARNLLEMIRIMNEDPSTTFVLDQVPHLEPFRSSHPDAFKEVKKFVSEGRLELVSGMYAEPDTNIPSGESLVRGCIMWDRYVRTHFRTCSRIGWLIDSFGQSAQLPQIWSKAGIQWVVFSRTMAGRDRTPSEFVWEGIDGSRVMAHWMPGLYSLGYPMPVDTADAMDKIGRGIKLLTHHALSKHLLYPCGVDHGRPQSIVAGMVKEWNKRNPKAKIHLSLPSRFFESLDPSGLPVLKGEFNRELWGTYGSRIELKILNRTAEFAIRDAEIIAAMAGLFGFDCKQEPLDRAWSGVLHNQFHDIICGCCVDLVARDAERRYQEAIASANNVISNALKLLGSRIDTSRVKGMPILIVNTLSFERTAWVEFEIDPTWQTLGVGLTDGRNDIPFQVVDSTTYGDGAIKSMRIGTSIDLPALGYRVIWVQGTDETSSAQRTDDPVRIDDTTIESPFFRIEIDPKTGLIRKILDKRSGHINLMNRGAELLLEKDFGHLYEPIVPGPLGRRSGKAIGIQKAKGSGPLRGGIEISGRIGRSVYSTKIALYRDIPRIDLSTDVDFRDPHHRLRLRFPTGISRGRWIHEIPYGVIERPGNELPAQNFVDLGGERHGITLINYGLPGHELVGDAIHLTLMRSSDRIFNMDAGPGGLDEGRHRFRCALYPHAGSWQEARSYRAAYDHNVPAICMPIHRGRGPLPVSFCGLSVEPPGILCSAMTREPDGTITLRLHEIEGRDCDVTIRPGFAIRRAWSTNLVGRERKRLSVREGAIRFRCGRFEIKTLRFEVEGGK